MKSHFNNKINGLSLLFIFFFLVQAHAQAPEKMSFQAVVRNSSNALVTSTGVGVKITILQGSASGTEVYKEIFNPNPTTNANGLLSIEIGTGFALTGTFSGIDWENGPYFIKTETDPTGGTNYSVTATAQLLSVPYALYAKTAGSSSNAWGLEGNAGTTTSNFIGTTDDVDLQLRVSNQKAGVIETSDNTTNTVQNANTALGYRSLEANTIGFGNVANGFASLTYNTTGSYNNAFGFASLEANTTGDENNAFGWGALRNNSTGHGNSAFGESSLYANITGNNNVAFGYQSLYISTTGSDNVASGTAALYNNTTGSDNVANGKSALFYNTSADKNTAVGREALGTITTGSNNTAIGYQAGSGLNGDRYNTTCLGFTTGWSTTNNNSVNIGNFSVGWIGGQVAWGNYSDKRIKNNIKENVPGLAFITQLTPVTYNLDIHKQYEIATNGSKDTTADYPGKYAIEKVTQTGFLAQDVEAAAKSIGYDFSGVEAPQDGQGLYKLRYSEFVVPIVKAIQEQQAQIEALKKENEELKIMLQQFLNSK